MRTTTKRDEMLAAIRCQRWELRDYCEERGVDEKRANYYWEILCAQFQRSASDLSRPYRVSLYSGHTHSPLGGRESFTLEAHARQWAAQQLRKGYRDEYAVIRVKTGAFSERIVAKLA